MKLPRQFETQFKRVGLDIEDFKIPLSTAQHRLKPNGIHTGRHNVALNMDGTWKHKPPHNWQMPQKARDYLESFGITIQPW